MTTQIFMLDKTNSINFLINEPSMAEVVEKLRAGEIDSIIVKCVESTKEASIYILKDGVEMLLTEDCDWDVVVNNLEVLMFIRSIIDIIDEMESQDSE